MSPYFEAQVAKLKVKMKNLQKQIKISQEIQRHRYSKSLTDKGGTECWTFCPTAPVTDMISTTSEHFFGNMKLQNLVTPFFFHEILPGGEGQGLD